MVIFQPNSQDQQFIEKLQDISMVDTSHEKIVVEANELGTKNAQPNSIGDPIEV